MQYYISSGGMPSGTALNPMAIAGSVTAAYHAIFTDTTSSIFGDLTSRGNVSYGTDVVFGGFGLTTTQSYESLFPCGMRGVCGHTGGGDRHTGVGIFTHNSPDWPAAIVAPTVSLLVDSSGNTALCKEGACLQLKATQSVADGVMAAGSGVLTSATGAFKLSDVDNTISVAGAGNAGGTVPLVTTIKTYTSATSVTLTANCAKTGGVSGAAVSWAHNGSIGTATLVAGTVTVPNTTASAGCTIFLTVSTPGGTQGFLSYSLSAGTSFTINSTNVADTSTVNWMIVKPI